MKNSKIALTLLLVTVSSALVAADSMQAIADRTLIRELMDRYGLVHDSGTAEEYGICSRLMARSPWPPAGPRSSRAARR